MKTFNFDAMSDEELNNFAKKGKPSGIKWDKRPDNKRAVRIDNEFYLVSELSDEQLKKLGITRNSPKPKAINEEKEDDDE